MDNPQHYQPLSHALNLPAAGPSQAKPTYTSYQKSPNREEEEEEEDDEGTVEEQLNRVDPDRPGSSPSSPNPKPDSTSEQKPTRGSPHDAEPKRRPGRPRGSKNRRPRTATTTTQSPPKPPLQYPSHSPLSSTATGTAPPQHPDVNTQNQQYYEFQWRVLNLCAEFYGAAEELVKGTQPLVIAQCYQMGPGNKVDPLVMLNEAKRICDTLLANPTRLIASPPPPMYPVVPNLYQGQPLLAPPPAGAKTNTAPTVITQPQSFVVPMGAQYPVYAAPPGTYPTAPYYQYGYAPPATYYTAPHPPPSQPSPSEESSRAAKDTTSRGLKRPRDTEDPDSPVRPNSAATVAQNSTSSPHSQPASTPIASPSLQNRPVNSATPAPTTASSLPWPMPTVAANTPSPVIAAASTQDQRVTSYYRPRPADASKPPVGHTYINYQPNGTTSRLTQNGK